MFSDNQRITAAQMKLLLLTDWAGKMMLVVPGMLGHIGARNAVLAAAAGTLLAAGAARGFGSIRIGKSRDYYSLLQMHLGTLGAAAVYLVYGIYLTGHTGLMLYLSGQVTGNYLLPGIAPAVTAVIPAVLGTWIAAEGIEVRGRVSELTGRIIWVLVFLLLFLAMRGIRPELLEYSGGVPDMQALTGTLSVAAVFGTLSVLPLVSSRIESPRKMGRKAAEAVVLTGILLLLALLAGYGILGSRGMERQKWPVIAVTNSASLSGLFLQRWDIALTALLEFALFLSIGGGIYYSGLIGSAWRKINRKISICITAAVSWMLAAAMERSEAVLVWTGRIVWCGCVPALTLSALVILMLQGKDHRNEKKENKQDRNKRQKSIIQSNQYENNRKKERKRKKSQKKRAAEIACVIGLITAGILLTGCTAIELEDRKFPLALELSTREDRIVLACAWPGLEQSGKQNEEDADNSRENEKDIDGNITRVEADSIEEAVQKIQKLQEKYVDYSQVKAILWDASLAANSGLEQPVLEWLEQMPAFAGNILIIPVDDGELTLEQVQERAEGQAGTYLENLCRNNTEYRDSVRTLTEVLYMK